MRTITYATLTRHHSRVSTVAAAIATLAPDAPMHAAALAAVRQARIELDRAYSAWPSANMPRGMDRAVGALLQSRLWASRAMAMVRQSAVSPSVESVVLSRRAIMGIARACLDVRHAAHRVDTAEYYGADVAVSSARDALAIAQSQLYLACMSAGLGADVSLGDANSAAHSGEDNGR